MLHSVPPLCSPAARRTGVKIDTTYTSENQDSRALFLVLHYTVGNFESSLRVLTQAKHGQVSSHYLVSRRTRAHLPVGGRKPPCLARRPELLERAMHDAQRQLDRHRDRQPRLGQEERRRHGELRAFRRGADGRGAGACPPRSCSRHRIRPERIVGHGEIQPRSKQDPGPFFPWKRFHEAGLIAWPDEAFVEARRAEYSLQLPGLAWFQDRLARHGYAPVTLPNADGQMDAYTRDCLATFQMRYRPSKYDGEMDAETAALLHAVTTPEAMKMKAPLAPSKPYSSRW